MSDRAALLAAIAAAPDDDTPRLVFADWLDEHGDHDRAALIRLQVELARLPVTADLYIDPETQERTEGDGPDAVLRRRQEELLRSVQPVDPEYATGSGCLLPARLAWAMPVALDPAERGWEFHRGFVDVVACAAADWLDHGKAMGAAHPVTTVRLRTWPAGWPSDLRIKPDGSGLGCDLFPGVTFHPPDEDWQIERVSEHGQAPTISALRDLVRTVNDRPFAGFAAGTLVLVRAAIDRVDLVTARFTFQFRVVPLVGLVNPDVYARADFNAVVPPG